MESITYVDVTPGDVRVEITNDTVRGIIEYRLQSFFCGKWYRHDHVTTFYNVPEPTHEAPRS